MTLENSIACTIFIVSFESTDLNFLDIENERYVIHGVVRVALYNVISAKTFEFNTTNLIIFTPAVQGIFNILCSWPIMKRFTSQ